MRGVPAKSARADRDVPIEGHLVGLVVASCTFCTGQSSIVWRIFTLGGGPVTPPELKPGPAIRGPAAHCQEAH